MFRAAGVNVNGFCEAKLNSQDLFGFRDDGQWLVWPLKHRRNPTVLILGMKYKSLGPPSMSTAKTYCNASFPESGVDERDGVREWSK